MGLINNDKYKTTTVENKEKSKKIYTVSLLRDINGMPQIYAQRNVEAENNQTAMHKAFSEFDSRLLEQFTCVVVRAVVNDRNHDEEWKNGE